MNPTSHSPDSSPRRNLSVRWQVWIATIGALALIVGSISRFLTPTKQRQTLVTAPPTVQIPDDAPTHKFSSGYLGPQSCVECHRDRVAEFMLTNHFRACRKPAVDAMPASFEPGQGHFVTPIPNLEFEMTRQGADFFESAILSTPHGPERTTSRIDLAYGFPPTDEVYFTWRGDRLYELPVAWMHPQHEWGISQVDPHGNGDFSRPLSVRCLECHNTWFEHTPGTLNQYNPDNFILGVTCERCHGPGQDHVAFHKSHPEEKLGKSIVHPGRLSRERLTDVCAQCHSNAIKHKGPAFNYRPGNPLEESYKTVSSRHPEDDHVANQTKYLRQSKCFQKSDSLTCVTCHNPHKPHERDPLKSEDSSNHSCFQCHTASSCSDRVNLPTAVQDKCVACHMPARNKIQVFFDTQHDAYVPPVKAYEHRIGIHPVARQEVLLDWHRSQTNDESRRLSEEIATRLNSHWLEEGERLRRDYRHLAAIDAFRRAVNLNPSRETKQKLQQTIADRITIDQKWFAAAQQIAEQKLSEAAQTLEEILVLKPDLAKAHGKLGAVYASLGQRERAIRHLQSVTEFDPDDPYGEGMLGWLDFLDGRYAEAIEHYRRADEIEPYKAKIHFQWGTAAARMNAWDQATNQFRQAMTIDPNHADACDSLSRVLQIQGQLKQAVQYAIQATRITNRKQPAMLLHLAELFAETQQFQDARQTASEALVAAQNSRSQLTPIIQKRLTEYTALEQKNK